MSFYDLAKKRFSVRKFSSNPVEQEKLDRILAAGNIAPTANNNQPQRIYVLKSEKALQTVNQHCRCIYGAPVVLMFTYNADEDWKNPQEAGIHSGEQDVSIVATHMILAATEQGLGSCWVNLFPNTELAKAFQLPENEKVVLLMPIGYADDRAVPVKKWHEQKKALEQTVKYI